MRRFVLTILGVMVVWPVHYNFATVSDKPIDLMPSDFLFVVLPIAYLFIRSKPTQEQCDLAKGKVHWYSLTPTLALLLMAYVTALAGVGLGMSGETVRLFSAFKLAKPIGFVFIGLLLGSWSDPFEFMDIFSKTFGAIVGLSFFFTVTDPNFPLGEWGKNLFDAELSGYPNMPMSFYGVMIPLLLAASDSTKNHLLKLSGWCLAGAAALIIVGSMSRSSTLAMLFATTIYLGMTGRQALLAGAFAVITFLSIVGFGLFSVLQDTQVVAVLTQRVQDRVDRSLETDDPSSGRYEIWEVALELCAEKPVFGYMFESFSRYMTEYDTPHQQYLEILYKSGSVGFGLYAAMLASCFAITQRLLKRTVPGAPTWYRLHAASAMLIGALIGNMTQPNLTYSLTGNMVFLLFGSFCSSRAVISAAQPINPVRPRSPLPVLARQPLRRAAA